jgi:hypothetical protein
VFTAGTSAQRYRGEFVFGKRTRTRSFAITTDPVHLPPETTWNVMTNLPGKIERTVGNTFGLRTQDPRPASSKPRTSSGGQTIGSRMPTVSNAGGNW